MRAGRRARSILGAALLPLAAVVLAAAPPPVDLAPPGMKTVRTQLRFELADAVADRRFAVAPGRGPFLEIEPGVPVTLRWSFGARVYALAPDEAVPPYADWRPPLSEEWPLERAQVKLPVERGRPVPASSPVTRVVHTVRLLAVDGDAIRFEVVGTEHLDAHGNPVDQNAIRAVWIALALTGAAGLWALARRRRREVREAATG